MKISKVLQNKLQKRAALLNSAYKLFTTVGFDKTTIRDIAHEAGVAKGTFYLYFNDKTDIREALVRSKASQLLHEAADCMEKRLEDSNAGMDIADKFIFIIDYLIDFVSEDVYFTKFISKHLSWGLFAGKHHTEQAFSDPEDASDVINFEEYIGDMLEADHVRVNNLRVLLFTLLELVSSVCYDIILYKEPMPLEEFRPHLHHTIRLIVEDAVITE